MGSICAALLSLTLLKKQVSFLRPVHESRVLWRMGKRQAALGVAVVMAGLVVVLGWGLHLAAAAGFVAGYCAVNRRNGCPPEALLAAVAVVHIEVFGVFCLISGVCFLFLRRFYTSVLAAAIFWPALVFFAGGGGMQVLCAVCITLLMLYQQRKIVLNLPKLAEAAVDLKSWI